MIRSGIILLIVLLGSLFSSATRFRGLKSLMTVSSKPCHQTIPIKRKNILILMSDTGGGHRSSGISIEEGLERAYPGEFNVSTLDIFTAHAPFPFSKLVPLYQTVGNYPLVWGSAYYVGLLSPVKKITEWAMRVSCLDRFQNAVSAYQPDLVISVHPLCNHVPMDVVRAINSKTTCGPIRFLTVVTDLGGAHTMWFNPQVDRCIVPSEAIKSIALKCGLSSERVVTRGLPIRSAFFSRTGGPKSLLETLLQNVPCKSSLTMSKDQLRQRLGLKENAIIVLLMSGGNGVGSIKELIVSIAEQLAEAGHSTERAAIRHPQIQLVVICGSNAKLQQEIFNLRLPTNALDVIAKGYIPNVHEFMQAADLLVTKAGPGTIIEAVACGLPMVISSYLPGQVAH